MSAAPALLLAAAVLLLAGPSSRGRLRGLRSAAAAPGAVPGSAPVLRGWSTALGAATVALLGWLVAGGPEAGIPAAIAAAGTGLLVAAGLRALAPRLAARRPASSDTGTGGLAAGWELLATCLEAGLPVPTAAEAAARRIEGTVAEGLRRAAGLLELGSAPAEAWAAVASVPGLEGFGRAARRSADTGAGLARVARAEAARLREGLTEAAEAKAERAAVLIAAPLGLCFLPAFLALGIAPVVIGLGGEVLARW